MDVYVVRSGNARFARDHIPLEHFSEGEVGGAVRRRYFRGLGSGGGESAGKRHRVDEVGEKVVVRSVVGSEIPGNSVIGAVSAAVKNIHEIPPEQRM